MKRYTDVIQIMINYILNHIRSMKTVNMVIRLSVFMMISIVNQFKYSNRGKMPFTSSWKKF